MLRGGACSVEHSEHINVVYTMKVVDAQLKSGFHDRDSSVLEIINVCALSREYISCRHKCKHTAMTPAIGPRSWSIFSNVSFTKFVFDTSHLYACCQKVRSEHGRLSISALGMGKQTHLCAHAELLTNLLGNLFGVFRAPASDNRAKSKSRWFNEGGRDYVSGSHL